jgi:hypothetical protein
MRGAGAAACDAGDRIVANRRTSSYDLAGFRQGLKDAGYVDGDSLPGALACRRRSTSSRSDYKKAHVVMAGGVMAGCGFRSRSRSATIRKRPGFAGERT